MSSLGFEQAVSMTASYRWVVAAPGVPIDHPDLLSLREAGAEIIGEVALAARLCPEIPLLGVTGTAGKGSTTLLIGQLLRAAGIQAKEGGNIDPPLLDVIEEAEVAVVELSSFQLERIADVRFPVAVVTNLGVDHLDRHLTIENYHAAKLNITAAQQPEDVLVVPPNLAHAIQTRAQVKPYREPSTEGLSVAGQRLEVNLPAWVYPANAAAALSAAEQMLTFLGRDLADLPERWAEALQNVPPVAGRFEEVACVGQVVFIEDSIATRTLAVTAALERAKPPIAWLVGGRDKGAELEALRAAAGGVIRVIAFGEDGERLAQGLGLPYEVVCAETPDQTMRLAIEAGWRTLNDAATMHTAPKGTVLLAPIGTSFDMFANYKERGLSFANAARSWVAEHGGGKE